MRDETSDHIKASCSSLAQKRYDKHSLVANVKHFLDPQRPEVPKNEKNGVHIQTLELVLNKRK